VESKEDNNKTLDLRGQERWLTPKSLHGAKERKAYLGQEIERLKNQLGSQNFLDRHGERMNKKKYKSFRARLKLKLKAYQAEHAYLSQRIKEQENQIQS